MIAELDTASWSHNDLDRQCGVLVALPADAIGQPGDPLATLHLPGHALKKPV
jgi:hypothetical protein